MGPSYPSQSSVIGYEGFYVVTNSGEVVSIPRWCGHYTTKLRTLKPESTKDGYLRAILSKNGKAKKFFVHRLIAEAFIPNPEGKPFVNHIDGNKKNNRPDNLEWCTAKENSEHAQRTGLVGPQPSKIPVDTRLAVIAYYVKGSSTHGCVGTAKKFGIGKQTVMNIVNKGV